MVEVIASLSHNTSKEQIKKLVSLGVSGFSISVRKNHAGVLVAAHKPTANPQPLEQVVKNCGKKRLFLELKQNGLEKQVAGFVKKHGLEKTAVVTSFNAVWLARTKKFNPQVRIGKLVIFDAWAAWHAPRYDVLVPFYQLSTSFFVRKAHANRTKVFAWGVEDARSAALLVGYGVDGIVTHVPQRLLSSKFKAH